MSQSSDQSPLSLVEFHDAYARDGRVRSGQPLFYDAIHAVSHDRLIPRSRSPSPAIWKYWIARPGTKALRRISAGCSDEETTFFTSFHESAPNQKSTGK